MPTKSSGIIFESRRFFGSDPGTIYEDVSREQATCTPTALDYTELASGLWVPTFNGSTSKVATGSDWIGVRAFSASTWIYAISLGGSNGGRIFDNARTLFFVTPTNKIALLSDGAGTAATSATSSISLSTWHHLFVTRTLAGVANFYIDGVLSGDEDQDSETPATVGSIVYVGNKADGSRAFDGYIDGLTVLSYIDADSPGLASNIFATERNLYGV
jgi:hypothetical protein